MADRFDESNNILIQSTNDWINVWTNRVLEAERVNSVMQNKNKVSAVCLKFLYVYY